MNPDTGSEPEPAATISTSTSLLERVETRDLQAWQRLVKLYGPMVYRWCRQAGLRSEDSKDIFQEVFSAVATHLDDFRRDRPGDSFRAWLCTITLNKVRDHYRRRGRQPEAEGGTQAHERLQQVAEELSADGDSSAAINDKTRLTQRAAQLVQAEFENRTWQVFWRATVQGQKPAEIAADLDMSVSAVYQANSRVMRRLRQEMENLLD